MPSIVLSTEHVLAHYNPCFNPHSNVMQWVSLLPHFTEEQVEVQRGSAVPTVKWLVTAGAGIRAAR